MHSGRAFWVEVKHIQNVESIAEIDDGQANLACPCVQCFCRAHVGAHGPCDQTSLGVVVIAETSSSMTFSRRLVFAKREATTIPSS